ncbi:hypothetical protein LTR66_017829, partial [Elasticomyces elasticus]
LEHIDVQIAEVQGSFEEELEPPRYPLLDCDECIDYAEQLYNNTSKVIGHFKELIVSYMQARLEETQRRPLGPANENLQVDKTGKEEARAAKKVYADKIRAHNAAKSKLLEQTKVATMLVQEKTTAQVTSKADPIITKAVPQLEEATPYMRRIEGLIDHPCLQPGPRKDLLMYSREHLRGCILFARSLQSLLYKLQTAGISDEQVEARTQYYLSELCEAVVMYGTRLEAIAPKKPNNLYSEAHQLGREICVNSSAVRDKLLTRVRLVLNERSEARRQLDAKYFPTKDEKDPRDLHPPSKRGARAAKKAKKAQGDRTTGGIVELEDKIKDISMNNETGAKEEDERNTVVKPARRVKLQQEAAPIIPDLSIGSLTGGDGIRRPTARKYRSDHSKPGLKWSHGQKAVGM